MNASGCEEFDPAVTDPLVAIMCTLIGAVMSAPSGVSHIAVVTGDLDGFRAFYEDTIGLRTTIVFGGGPGHSRQAILMAGDAMLHVFEVVNDQTTSRGVAAGMFEGAGSTTWGSP